MDSSSSVLRSAEHLRERIGKRVGDIGKAMREILEMSQPSIDPATGEREPVDPTSLAAVTKAYKVEIATQTMIRISEELLTLIRQMQEVWLFGKLDTLGKSEVEERTEEDAKRILKLLQQMAEVKGDGETNSSSS